jgi:hypothetical protein
VKDYLWILRRKEFWTDELREPAPTLEELWKRIALGVPRWKNRHRPMDVGKTNLEDLGLDAREMDAYQGV